MSASATWTEQRSAQHACRRRELTAAQAALSLCHGSGVLQLSSRRINGMCCSDVDAQARCVGRGAAVVARTEGDIAYFAVGTGEYNELTRGHPQSCIALLLTYLCVLPSAKCTELTLWPVKQWRRHCAA